MDFYKVKDFENLKKNKKSGVVLNSDFIQRDRIRSLNLKKAQEEKRINDIEQKIQDIDKKLDDIVNLLKKL